MAAIDIYLQQILSAVYGEEVRGSIHDAIAAMNVESTTAISTSQTAQNNAATALTNSQTAIATSNTALAEVRQYISGGIQYKGTCSFANLPVTGNNKGDMWNISDAFEADNRFRPEDRGKTFSAGTNVIYDANNLWDTNGGLLAGSLLKDGSVTADKLMIGANLTSTYPKLAVGQYNEDKNGTVFEVGYGLSSASKLNLFEVFTDGHVNINGDLYQNGSRVSLADFIGATSSADGSRGMVPAPLASAVEKYLKNDGTWSEIVFPNPVPDGGYAGQFLAKTTNDDGDFGWNGGIYFFSSEALADAALNQGLIHENALILTPDSGVPSGGGGGTLIVDTQLSTTSTNPVQNCTIANAINLKQNVLTPGNHISIQNNEISATGIPETLNDITDVVITSPNENSIIGYDETTSKFINKNGNNLYTKVDGTNSSTIFKLKKNLMIGMDGSSGTNTFSNMSISKPAGSNQTVTFTGDISSDWIIRLTTYINEPATNAVYAVINETQKAIRILTVTSTEITAKLVDDTTEAISVASSYVAFKFMSTTNASSISCFNSGIGTYTREYYNSAFGWLSQALNYGSFANGNKVIAKAGYSHAEGVECIAEGYGSHAEGCQTKTTESYSHAEGVGTITSQLAQLCTGKYNNNKTDTLFEVGNGTGINIRKNAFEVTNDGYIRTKGRTDKIAFGVDANGNYGYIKAGADTVIPFSTPVRTYKISSTSAITTNKTALVSGLTIADSTASFDLTKINAINGYIYTMDSNNYFTGRYIFTIYSNYPTNNIYLGGWYETTNGYMTDVAGSYDFKNPDSSLASSSKLYVVLDTTNLTLKIFAGSGTPDLISKMMYNLYVFVQE